MKRNKLYSMLLSIVVAFGLWLYVKNNVSIEDNNTFYNIPDVNGWIVWFNCGQVGIRLLI